MLHHVIIGSGKPILILHGVSLDHRYMVDALEPAFQEVSGWKRIYVDMPGHGKSPARNTIRSQDDLLAAVVEFIEQVIPEEPFGIVGLSRGSYIARGIIHQMPARVTGAALVVAGGNPSSDPGRLPPVQVMEPDPSIRTDLADDEVWAFDNMSVIQTRDIVEKRRRIIAPARQLFDADQDSRVFDAFEFSFAEQEASLVFGGPSLIVAGRQDSVSGYLDSMDLSVRFPRSSLAVLDTAGHGLAWERPELFKALMLDWLVRLSKADPAD